MIYCRTFFLLNGQLSTTYFQSILKATVQNCGCFKSKTDSLYWCILYYNSLSEDLFYKKFKNKYVEIIIINLNLNLICQVREYANSSC